MLQSWQEIIDDGVELETYNSRHNIVDFTILQNF